MEKSQEIHVHNALLLFKQAQNYGLGIRCLAGSREAILTQRVTTELSLGAHK